MLLEGLVKECEAKEKESEKDERRLSLLNWKQVQERISAKKSTSDVKESK